MDSSRFRTGEIVAGIGGIALFVCLFFDWFSAGIEGFDRTKASGSRSASSRSRSSSTKSRSSKSSRSRSSSAERSSRGGKK